MNGRQKANESCQVSALLRGSEARIILANEKTENAGNN